MVGGWVERGLALPLHVEAAPTAARLCWTPWSIRGRGQRRGSVGVAVGDGGKECKVIVKVAGYVVWIAGGDCRAPVKS